ncbi:MAG: SDR family oxidoreductase [Bacteroidetes bacterium]|nr:SDR family oxidoreductase [Bacteroidota bacterium]MCH8523432.1 SDR family oxidoreductase [Balneolales bacterium]
MNYYQNKTIWITGASSGIGEALVADLIAQGANIIISARREAELQRVFSENGADANRMLVLPLDVGMHEKLHDAARTAIDWKGRLDILINNAGISQRAFVHDTNLDIEKRLFDINYFGTVELTRAVLPHMMKNRSGHIVVMSSVLGKMSVPMRSTYCSTKHALHGYFDALRAEIHQLGIHVTLVCPGYIKTEVSINAFKADGSKHATLDASQAKGMMPEVFSKKMLKKVAARREEFYVGGIEIFAVLMKRLFPWLVSRVVRRISPVIRRFKTS